jgi:hypothetical protein
MRPIDEEIGKPEYQSLSATDAAEHFNAKTVVIRDPIIPISWVLQWAGSGPLDSIEALEAFDHPDAGTRKAVRSASKAAMRLFGGVTDTFNLDSGTNRALLGVFVMVGAVTQGEVDDLLSYGDVSTPLYARPGFTGSRLTAEDIQAIRGY